MFSLHTVVVLLLAHLVADFFFQDEKWANNKWEDIDSLLSHVFMYTFIFSIITITFIPELSGFFPISVWVVSTFISHLGVDYLTSKVVHKKFEKQEYGSSIPNFGAFSFIGIDQYTHYVLMFLTLRFIQFLITL